MVTRYAPVFAVFLVAFGLSMAVITASADQQKIMELPSVIEQALNEAAATGNPLVVDSVAQQMVMTFPLLEPAINVYVMNFARPAAGVMAIVDEEIFSAENFLVHYTAPEEYALGTPMADEPLAEEDIASLAATFNDLDVGSPEAVSLR